MLSHFSIQLQHLHWGNQAETATLAKALDLHSSYQACALNTVQRITVKHIYYAQADKSLILHNDLDVKPEAVPGWSSY